MIMGNEEEEEEDDRIRIDAQNGTSGRIVSAKTRSVGKLQKSSQSSRSIRRGRRARLTS